MRILSKEEMLAVTGGGDDGGVRLGTVTISSDRASKGSSTRDGGGGHSVSSKNYPVRDQVTGYPVYPGGLAGKVNRDGTDIQPSGFDLAQGVSSIIDYAKTAADNLSHRSRGQEPR